MYELNREAVDKARPLFAELPHPQQVLIEAVWAGNHVGRLFVDDRDAPASALLYAACDFIVLAGEAHNGAFNQAWHKALVQEILPSGWCFFMDPGERWNPVLDRLFAGSTIHRATRSAFTLYDERVRARMHTEWRQRIPEGYEVRRYDRDLAAGAPDLAQFWGSIDNFLANGVGVAVVHGDEVVSRCHTVFVGKGEAEISIETQESHRRRGLAALTANAFIEQCAERGLKPAWSCWSDNKPSVALAEHLGFVRGPDVPMVIVEPLGG
ncbi:MAG: GNAT family N-acetyltransferase [Anaerolineae bacterium]